MATGFTACLVDRALTGTWTLKTGSAVTGYPLANLNDWRAGNQYRVTGAANVAQVMLDLGAAPSSASNTDWHINCFGLVNHNLDGMTVTVKSHTSDDYANATTRFAATALDANMGNPNMLVTFAAAGARYWYVNISHASALVSPVRIGRIVLGYAFDLGYPMEGWGLATQPSGGVARTATGVMLGGRFTDPLVSKNLRFSDPTNVSKNLIWNPAVTAATTYPTYTNVRRLLESGRQNPIDSGSATTYSGVTAGSGVPMLYHEGDAIGLSSAGRPAKYGVISLDTVAMQESPTNHPISLTITDCVDANNRNIQPPTN